MHDVLAGLQVMILLSEQQMTGLFNGRPAYGRSTNGCADANISHTIAAAGKLTLKCAT